MRFPNQRFLYFCREYNVKMVFWHDLGSRKSIKNVTKIHIKFDTRKVMQKASKKSKNPTKNHGFLQFLAVAGKGRHGKVP